MNMRSCGGCSLCCKVFEIKDRKLKKPANKWCQHCKVAKGCVIYESRPKTCKDFECLWLQNQLDDYWYPRISNIVVQVMEEGHLEFRVDHEYPNRWREEPYYSQISCFLSEGDKQWLPV